MKVVDWRTRSTPLRRATIGLPAVRLSPRETKPRQKVPFPSLHLSPAAAGRSVSHARNNQLPGTGDLGRRASAAASAAAGLPDADDTKSCKYCKSRCSGKRPRCERQSHAPIALVAPLKLNNQLQRMRGDELRGDKRICGPRSRTKPGTAHGDQADCFHS